ncbi:hypothetical protein BV898_02567 [Hypsibius exemplaris]|uniref:Uncharacterized protein n=1 Tax=Hypsibius exemplaris TaxID=2072580 RepID=A0A1W0X7E1_HYPEX|nr:hypothetical protein BV898_02567 [Hypsibius exemplaris]
MRYFGFLLRSGVVEHVSCGFGGASVSCGLPGRPVFERLSAAAGVCLSALGLRVDPISKAPVFVLPLKTASLPSRLLSPRACITEL